MDVTDTLSIPDDELHFTYARSGGPGGQNVNKVASKAVLHWDLVANTSLPADVKERLRQHQANRITAEGQLVIQGSRFRDQGRNTQDCLERLRAMVLQALNPPTPRRITKPTRGSKRRRLADKRQQSERKAQRKPPAGE